MKNSYKAALLAALGLAVVSSAQAQSGMLLGFTGGGNDGVLSLGNPTSFSTSASLNGTIPSNFVFPATGSVGIAGFNDNAAGTGGIGYIITPSVFDPTATVFNIGSAQGSMSGVATGFYTTSSGNTAGTGWSFNVAQDFQTGDASGNGVSEDGTGFPMVQLSGGTASFQIDRYAADSTGSTVTTTDLGTFTVNLGNDTWSFQGASAAVPEPSTYGLIAGAGLLLVGVRRQFVKKNA